MERFFYLLLSSLLERLINADTIMSPQVGQAGKRLFEFFERRWEQLAPNMDWEREGGRKVKLMQDWEWLW